MDRSLDDIISERPSRPSRGGRRPESRRAPPPRAPRRDEPPRDGVRKFRREEPVNIDSDWVHDRFEDDRYDRNRRQPAYNDRDGPRERAPESGGSKIRVDNVHYDLTEDDLRGLFEQKGPTASVKLLFDRMDRSQGTAFVIYEDPRDARRAIADYDGCNANGQPIRLTLMPSAPGGRGSGGGASLFDRIERPERSLFERMGDRDDGRDDRNRRHRDRSDSPRKSDVRGPVPEHIDRYVPNRGSRSPVRRRGTPRESGRRPGARREESGRAGRGGRRGDGEGRPATTGRPKKTAEELDAEMEDYWSKPANNGDAEADGGASAAAPAVTTGHEEVAGDDVDMIT